MGTKHTRPVSSFGDPSFCAPASRIVYFTDEKIAMRLTAEDGQMRQPGEFPESSGKSPCDRVVMTFGIVAGTGV